MSGDEGEAGGVDGGHGLAGLVEEEGEEEVGAGELEEVEAEVEGEHDSVADAESGGVEEDAGQQHPCGSDILADLIADGQSVHGLVDEARLLLAAIGAEDDDEEGGRQQFHSQAWRGEWDCPG